MPTSRSSFVSDLSGGLTAAVIALPLAIAFGVATFAPLGPEHAPLGAVAGMTAAIVGCFVASLVGGTPAQITGPTGPMTVVLSAVVAMLVAAPPPAPTPEAQVGLIVTLVLLTAFLGGMVQIGLGLLRVGAVVKFIPYPVVAGFMNGIALIIVLGQIRPLVGASSDATWGQMLAGGVSLPIVAVGVLTIGATALTPKLTQRVPAALAGLAVGTLGYYALAAAGQPMGAVVGSVPSVVPTPHHVLDFIGILSDEALLEQLPRILPSALALGVLGAIDSLLTSVVADVVTGDHHDSDQELIGQGLGNMASACFGGIAGAGTTVVTLVNIDAGGRSPRAGMLHSVALLGVMLVAAPLAGAIPLVVLAGILSVTAMGMLDGWSRKLFVRVLAQPTTTRSTWANLALVVIVTGITVSVDLMIAVAIGLTLAGMLFVSKIGRGVVRRVNTGQERHSFADRSDEERAVLHAAGGRIAVVELDGAVFFGSSDRLVREVEAIAESADFVILDAHHVSEIDGSGARALQQLHDLLVDQNKELAISYVTSESPLWRFLGEMGDVEVIGEDHFFPDTDHALEWAEERLLSSHEELTCEVAVPFADCPITRGLDPEQREALHGYMAREPLTTGARLYEAGTVHTCLWLLLRGRLTVLVRGECGGRETRVTTIRPGHVVGERGFFAGQPHSFSIEVGRDGEALVLTQEAFAKMKDERPDLAIRLLYNLGGELSERIHTIGRTVAALEG